jgi:hypothetical protein
MRDFTPVHVDEHNVQKLHRRQTHRRFALKVPKRQIRRPTDKPTKKIPKKKLINQLLAAKGCQLHTMDSDLEEGG